MTDGALHQKVCLGVKNVSNLTAEAGVGWLVWSKPVLLGPASNF